MQPVNWHSGASGFDGHASSGGFSVMVVTQRTNAAAFCMAFLALITQCEVSDPS
jgi:hypothetical protein